MALDQDPQGAVMIRTREVSEVSATVSAASVERHLLGALGPLGRVLTPGRIRTPRLQSKELETKPDRVALNTDNPTTEVMMNPQVRLEILATKYSSSPMTMKLINCFNIYLLNYYFFLRIFRCSRQRSIRL